MTKKKTKGKHAVSKGKQGKAKKKEEEVFVSDFLSQPGKTRSGTVYSKRNLPTGCFTESAGASFNSACTEDPTKNLTSLQTAKSQCSCKQCTTKRQKEGGTTCSNNNNNNSSKNNNNKNTNCGLAKSNEAGEENLTTSETSGLCSSSKVVHNDTEQTSITSYYPNHRCNCHECSHSYIPKKLRLRHSMRVPNKNWMKRKKKKHPLEYSAPTARKHRLLKVTQPSAKRKSMRKELRKHIKRSKSLLKYVLSKKSSRDVHAKNPPISAKSSKLSTCLCCQRFLTSLMALYTENKILNQGGGKKNKQLKQPKISQERLFELWKPCEKLKRSLVPQPRSGRTVHRSTCSCRTAKRQKMSDKCSHNVCRNKFLFPSAGAIGNRLPLRKKNVRNKRHMPTSVMVAPEKRLSDRRRTTVSISSKRRNQLEVQQRTTKNKWRLLANKMYPFEAKLWKKHTIHRKNKMNKKSAKQRPLKIAPAPRGGSKAGSKRSHRASSKAFRKKYLCSNTWPSSLERNMTGKEFRKLGITKFPGAPVPSARVPTFIAMVKTAIRDLRPFHITGKDAIAK